MNPSQPSSLDRTRRTRAAVAVAGSVLAVAAVAAAVPALRGATAGSTESAAPPAAAGATSPASSDPLAHTAPSAGSDAREGDASEQPQVPAEQTARATRRASTPKPTATRAAARPTDNHAAAQPANVLDWPGRGATSDIIGDLHRAYDKHRGGVPQTQALILFAGSDDAGAKYVLAQMWVPGDQHAQTVGFVVRPSAQPELRIHPRLRKDAHVAAMLVRRSNPGVTTDTLVVVPRPRTGQVEYAPDDQGYRAVGAEQGYLDGVVLVDRAPSAATDRLRLYDGNGRVHFEGRVASLL